MPRKEDLKTKAQLIAELEEWRATQAISPEAIHSAVERLEKIVKEITGTLWGYGIGIRRWKRWKKELPAALEGLRAALRKRD